MLVKVKSGCKGFYYGKRRKSGDTFDLKEGDPFSEKWMEKLEAPVAKKKLGRPKASKTDKKESDAK